MNWSMTLEIIGLIGGIVTMLAFFLMPMLWLGSKIDALREEVTKETKDFHGRLCAIEEKNRK
jgi:hypothetical protein